MSNNSTPITKSLEDRQLEDSSSIEDRQLEFLKFPFQVAFYTVTIMFGMLSLIVVSSDFIDIFFMVSLFLFTVALTASFAFKEKYSWSCTLSLVVINIMLMCASNMENHVLLWSIVAIIFLMGLASKALEQEAKKRSKRPTAIERINAQFDKYEVNIFAKSIEDFLTQDRDKVHLKLETYNPTDTTSADNVINVHVETELSTRKTLEDYDNFKPYLPKSFDTVKLSGDLLHLLRGLPSEQIGSFLNDWATNSEGNPIYVNNFYIGKISAYKIKGNSVVEVARREKGNSWKLHPYAPEDLTSEFLHLFTGLSTLAKINYQKQLVKIDELTHVEGIIDKLREDN